MKQTLPQEKYPLFGTNEGMEVRAKGLRNKG